MRTAPASRRLRFHKSLFLIATVGCVAFAQAGNGGTEVMADDYSVYNAAIDLMQLPRENAHVLIAGKTVDFQCGPDANGPARFNECDGMRMEPDTPGQVINLLQKSWKTVAPATWSDFEKKNAGGARLQDKFSTPWPHKLLGSDDWKPGDDSLRNRLEAEWARKSSGADRSDPAKAWDAPDMLIFFSRVGFNERKTEAIVYIVSLSHMEELQSNGNYFLFRLEGKEWKPHGRVQYMSANDDGSWAVAQVPPAGVSRPRHKR